MAPRPPLDGAALASLFTEARTHHGWLPLPVPDQQLQAIYALARSGPTSMNSQPMRVRFIRDPARKEALIDCLNPGNVAKTRAAPVTAVIGHDLDFAARLPQLYPHKADARESFDRDPEHAAATAFRNGSLQAAYLMLAARALGLDCGPMSGFDAPRVDALIWAGTRVRTNFLCNLGHGDPAALHARGPRLEFDAACELL